VPSKLVATALLKSKTAIDYCKMWTDLAHHVKWLKENKEKLIINMDFEISHHNAIKEVFGDKAIIVGCLFHLIQAVHKWLKRKGDPYFGALHRF